MSLDTIEREEVQRLLGDAGFWVGLMDPNERQIHLNSMGKWFKNLEKDTSKKQS
jgi:hypothetical protein